MGGSHQGVLRRARITKLIALVGLATSLLPLGAPHASAEPASNDLIENATAIDSLPFTATQSIQDAWSSPTDPAVPCATFGPPPFKTVWYRYVAPSAMALKVSSGTEYSSVVASFAGPPDSLSPLGCSGQIPHVVNATAGTTYYFMLVAPSYAGGTATINVRAVTPPTNDLIESATVIDAVPYDATQSTQDATVGPTDPTTACPIGPGPVASARGTVWFAYTPATDAVVRVGLTTSRLGPSSVSTFAGPATALVPITCGYDRTPYAVSLTGGSTYYFMVDLSVEQTITLSLQLATPPANDTIDNATLIEPIPFSTTMTTTDASASQADPDGCLQRHGGTVWLTYTSTTDAQLRFTVPEVQAGLVSFEGTPGSLSRIGCSASQVIDTRAGTTYYFMVITVGAPSVTFTAHAPQAPANDLIENATVVSQLPFSASQVTDDATHSATDPALGCDSWGFLPDVPTIWFTYDAPSVGLLKVEASGPWAGTAVDVFDGASGTLARVGCSSEGATYVPVEAGKTYYFMVINSRAGTAVEVDIEATVPVPNDYIENATVIDNLPFHVEQSTEAATTSPSDPAPPPSCYGYGQSTVWFRFTPPQDMSLRPTLTNATAALAVYEGSIGSLTPVGCPGGGSYPPTVSVKAGTSYFFMVRSSTPNLTLDVVLEPPPANDLIENAADIGTLPFGVTQSFAGATASPSDPASLCGVAGDVTVWFGYSPLADGAITVSGTSFPPSQGPLYAVYEGTPGALTEVGCGANGTLPTVSVDAGKSYFIIVRRLVDQTSSFNLTVQMATTPQNDRIENATVIQALPHTTVVDTQGATSSPTDPAMPCWGNRPASVWYRYDAASSTAVDVHVTNPVSLAAVEVLEGSPSSLQHVECVLGPGTRRVSLAAGKSYYFMVTGGAPGDTTLDLQLAPDSTAPTLTLPAGISVPATRKTGAVVTYTATATDDTDPSPVVSCTPASGTTFKIGDTTVNCTANDASGNSSTGSFNVHVKGANEQIQDLRRAVWALPSKAPREALDSLLKAASTALRNNDAFTACSKLQEFKDMVRAEKGKTIPSATADKLVVDASRIRAVICW